MWFPKAAFTLLIINVLLHSFLHCFASDSVTEEGQSGVTDISCHSNRRPLLLASTLDGKITALDRDSGQLIWSLDSSGPLLSSSLSSIKSAQDLVKLRYIPSLDGILFQLKGEKIEVLPFSTEALVGKIQRLADGSHLIGGKEISLSGIDLQSGLLQYECSTVGCYPFSKQSTHISQRDILVLRRIQHTVRAVDQRTGNERWNYSVGSFELELPEILHNHYQRRQGCSTGTKDIDDNNRYSFNIGEGTITRAVPGSDASKFWTFELKSPLSAVWKLENNALEPLDLFKYGLLKGIEDEEIKHQPLRYLGIHEGQVYVQHPPKVSIVGDSSSAREAGFTPVTNKALVVAQPFIGGWRPYISSSPSRTPSLMNDKSLTIWNNVDYPYDNGYYIISIDKDVKNTELLRLPSKYDRDKKEFYSDRNFTDKRENEEIFEAVLLYWWKEILVFAILLSICMQICYRFLRKKLKLYTEKIEVEEAVVEEEPISPCRRSYPSVSYSTDSGEYELAPASTNYYASSYLEDFDHQMMLGKGGFGVVFKARKRVDDCEYAVKRIQIPSCTEARDKVMREVRALAKLEHPGIVRYFHSWWENPPKGWQKKTDSEFLGLSKGEDESDALSMDWCVQIEESDTNEYNEIHKGKASLKSYCGNGYVESNTFDVTFGNEIMNNELSSMYQYSKSETYSNVERKKFSKDRSIQIEFEDRSIQIEFEDSKIANGGSQGDVERKCSVSSVQEEESYSTEDYHINEVNKREKNDLNQHKSKPKYVGKCCGKSSNCIISSPSFFYIQMQLCKPDTLKDWLQRSQEGERQKTRCLQIFCEIVNAVSYFHSKGMMHRDLKPSNIFFSFDGKVKVGDFGLVTAVTRPSDGQGPSDHHALDNHTGQVGTQLYMSPEQIQGKAYNHKVDIYSLGVILLELLNVFSTEMERISVLRNLQSGVIPQCFCANHQEEADLVISLVSKDPGARLEAEQIKNRLEEFGTFFNSV